MMNTLSAVPPSLSQAIPAVDRDGSKSAPHPGIDKSGELPPLDVPVNIRSVSLAFLSFLAGLFALQWAREVVIPILFGVILSYSLTPFVARLQTWRIPRAVSAAVLLCAIAVGLGWGTWSLSDQVDALTDTLPEITHKIRDLTQSNRGTVSTIEKVQQAATEIVSAAGLEASAASAASAPPSRRGGEHPQVTKAPSDGARGTQIDIRGYVLSGTIGAMVFLGQVAVVFCVAFFLLASGNSFRRKLVKLAGPRMSQKKVTIETLDEISTQIQRYLLVQLAISAIIGIATGLAFLAVGMNQAAVWGIVAGVTNLIPYLGALLVGAGSGAFALVQFGTFNMVLLVGGLSFAIHSLIGNLLTPWWTGKASKMSPVAVFIAVLLFGWLWGVAGLLLGVPILMVVKAVCDRIEDLAVVGELLGE